MRIVDDESVKESVPMAQQEMWADVVPLPQDDGEMPVCPIAYTDEYREMMDYLRAVMAKGEVSSRALDLSGRVIEANPGHYTVWVYRKRLVEELGADIGEELDWVGNISAKYPKNYQLWHHREALVGQLLGAKEAAELTEDQLIAHPVVRRELQFLASAIESDSKNFHAWSYRQWLIGKYQLWAQELAFVETMINQDVRNNSAWNQRYFVVLQGGDPATAELDDAVHIREIEYTVEHIKLAPNNDSPWSYIVGMLLRHAPQKLYTDLLPRIQKLAADPGYKPAMTTTPFYWSALVDIYEQQASDTPVSREELLQKAQSVCDELAAEHDVTRGRYWEFRKTTLCAA
ncbi:CAAX geranylgeranyltransferase alpha subunit [Coemansia sp. RSA 552]|nr:CAAX geranylgeranyltransferase alpha subunit [Coemansia sp. RSA 552]